MFSECRVCGLRMAFDSICSVCEIGEACGMVMVWKGSSWTCSIYATDESTETMPEPDHILPAADFAEFVRQERKQRGY